MKVRRLLKATGYGVFAGFEWPADLQEFQDRNLIYGWNGSGKSTLASMLRELETRRRARIAGEYEFETDRGRIGRDGINGTEDSPSLVRVFNEAFVSESVFTTSGQMPPVLYLGKQSIAKQTELTTLREQLDAEEADYARRDAEARAAEVELDRFRVDQGHLIKEALRSDDHTPYNNYDKAAFKAKADTLKSAEFESSLLTDPERNKLQARAHSRQQTALAALKEDIELSDVLQRRTEAALARSVVSQGMPRLTGDPELGQWVEAGLHLHQERGSSVCLFCEQGLGPRVLAGLEQHFSNAFADSAREVEELLGVFEVLRRDVAELNLPVSAELSPHLLSEFASALHQLTRDREAFLAGIASATGLLRRKRADPFSKIELPSFAATSLRQALMAVNTVLKAHNQVQADFSAEVANARRTLEQDFVAQALPRLLELEAKLESLTNQKTASGEAKSDFGSKIKVLKAETAEHGPAAGDLTSDLADFLGREELRFEVDGPGYRLWRNGEPADGLSQGEKSAIALLYFLKSLDHKDFDQEHGVVVIDDPVSSLDSNALFCALGYLQAKTEKVGQLFLLTHNFGFFREVRKWLKPRGQKALRWPCSLYFLSCATLEGRRRARLTKLDSLLEDFDSEYQYLFKLVLEASGESETESRALAPLFHYPNVGRRLLEAFTAFRFPDETGSLRGRLGQTNLSPAKRERMLRILDVQSHADGVGIPEEGLSSLQEVQTVLRDLLSFIQYEDEKHFKRMVRLVEAAPRGNG